MQIVSDLTRLIADPAGIIFIGIALIRFIKQQHCNYN